MTCDNSSSSSGKTIAFSHRCFQKGKPDLLRLVDIMKDKDIAASKKAKSAKKESKSKALPASASAPASLRLPVPATAPLPDEIPRTANASLTSMAAAEHSHHLSSHGPEAMSSSLSTALSDEVQQRMQQRHLTGPAIPRDPAFTGQGSQEYSHSLAAHLDSGNQSQIQQQHAHPLWQQAGAGFSHTALELHRRNSAMLQHLTGTQPSLSDERTRLHQTGLLGLPLPNQPFPSSLTNHSSLFQHSNLAPSLLPQATGTSREVQNYLSQLASGAPRQFSSRMSANQSALTNFEQEALLRFGGREGSGQGSLQSRTLGVPPPAGSAASATALTPEELRYLAELQRLRRGL